MKKVIIGLLVLVLLGGVITLLIYRSGGLVVSDAWARPGKAGGNSAVYLVIDNRAASQDALLSASCDAAMMTQVHQTSIDASGTASMHEQESVPVAAYQQVSFQPGGLHVMLMKLKQDLAAGDTLQVTLTFEKAGQVEIEAQVREP